MDKKYKILEFPQLGDQRGQLVVAESMKDIPFDIKRIFYIYDTKGDVIRGQHANKNSSFVLINLKGECKIKADDGFNREVIVLDKPYKAVYMGKMVWKDMYDFSKDSILLVLSDYAYDKNEYITNYEEFLKEVTKSADNSNLYFKHPMAIVDSPNIGKDTKVWGFSHVLPNAVVGENCNLCEHVFVENDVTLGNNVTVKCGVYIWDGITVEDNVFIGPSVTFVNDKHPRSKQYPEKFERTIIKKGASLGANSTIMCSITVGEYATVGAGAVAVKSVKPYEVVVGNPAKVIGYNCRCGKRLDVSTKKIVCDCGSTYVMESKGLKFIE